MLDPQLHHHPLDHLLKPVLSLQVAEARWLSSCLREAPVSCRSMRSRLQIARCMA